jgi:hypothetical protein
MSLLPQRKKSPEEIAKLRENLGVPGASQAIATAPVPPPVSEGSGVTAADRGPEGGFSGDAKTADLQSLAGPAPSHGGSPQQPPGNPQHLPAQSSAGAADPVAAPHREAKPVRTLRKSGRVASPPGSHPESPPDSKLPHCRHTDDEIAEIRRRDVLALMAVQPNPRLAPAHPALILTGYLSTIAGAAGIWFQQIPILATFACALVSFVMAGFIFLHKPMSRHHAAFIAALALFLLIFGSLHYFPHLRHAT